MARRSVLALAAAAALLGLMTAAHAAGAFDPRDFTGTWDRYPTPKPGTGVDPAVPPPPLKPQYLADYQAHMKAVAEANARGEPPVTGYVRCLPDGMPAMMMGMFPMEVLQTRGQVTIIEEAYNQVRRIYLDERQIPIDDAEPGFWATRSAIGTARCWWSTR